MGKSHPDSLDTLTLETRVRLWLRGQRMNGVKVLSYLMDNANTPIHVSYLDWCCAKDVWPEPDKSAIHGFEAQPLIPMVDHVTIKQCRQVANTLIKQIQGAVELGDEKLEKKLRLEYDLLMKYIRQSTTPAHKIKNFDPYWEDAYHNVFTCVYKAVKKLAKSHPEEAEFIVSRLQKGQRFMWKDPRSPHWRLDISIELHEDNYDLG